MAGKVLFLLVLCSILALTSIIAIFHAHQLPTVQHKLIQLCTYEQAGIYDYTAILGPNLIYNQSTLKPGEGILYTRITEYINTTFSYEFKLSGLDSPANITIEYSINAYLLGPYWRKGFNIVPQTVLNLTGTAAHLSANHLVNTTRYEEIIEAIRSETGTYARECNLTISPEIHTVAATSVGTIDEYFTPSMRINLLQGGPEGDHISIEGTEHVRTGAIEESQRIFLTWVVNLRYTSYAFSAITFPAFAYSTWSFMKTRPKLREEEGKTLEEIIEPFEEILVEIAEEPSYEGQRVVIKTLEGLFELADGLEKPVFHFEKAHSSMAKESTHTFYVLDGLVRYEYTITVPRIEEKAEPVIEYEESD